MAISFFCGCGRELSVSEALAGRGVRCPSCGGILKVPTATATSPGQVSSRQRSSKPRSIRRGAAQAATEWHNPSYDMPEPLVTPARPDSSGSGSGAGVAIPATLLAFIIVVAVVAMVAGTGYGVVRFSNTMAEARRQNEIRERVDREIDRRSSGLDENEMAAHEAHLLGAGGMDHGLSNAEAMAIAGVDSAADDAWIVLSQLQVQRSYETGTNGQFNITVDYSVSAGSPHPGRNYYLYLTYEDDSGRTQSVQTPIPVARQRKGVLSLATRLDDRARNTLRANAGYPGTQGDHVYVSGQLRVGETHSSTSPVVSASAIAGRAAMGKTVAIANLKVSDGVGGTIRLDFQRQMNLKQGAEYYLVLEKKSLTMSNKTECEITDELLENAVGSITLARPETLDLKGIRIFVEERLDGQVSIASNSL
ncbi:MAG: hypothetical protein KDA96_15960 [Planctomycetaceae bacterium]|nr:hypothetical protein [Planctomycetaceae bacterium]